MEVRESADSDIEVKKMMLCIERVPCTSRVLAGSLVGITTLLGAPDDSKSNQPATRQNNISVTYLLTDSM